MGVTSSAFALSLQQGEINSDGKLGFSLDNGDGIIWLDNDVTRGKTITEMYTIATDYGLQWATEAMIQTLHQNLANLTGGWTSRESTITGAADFSNSNASINNQSQLKGFFPVTTSTGVSSVLQYQIYEWWVTQYSDATPDTYTSQIINATFDATASNSNVGGWLYKMADSGGQSPVPEPATMLLFGLGLLGLTGVNRRKK